MDNQHQKISGYRNLGSPEIALINEIKATEATVLDLIGKVMRTDDVNLRSANIARTDIQTGFMWLIRAVARPNGE
jgi:hypothetical protein